MLFHPINLKEFIIANDEFTRIVLHQFRRQAVMFLIVIWISLKHNIQETIDIRGAYDVFPDFFRMVTLIDSTHMKL